MRKSSASSSRVVRRLRVRSRPLDQLDETRLALAVFLMAKRLVEDRTDPAPATGTAVEVSRGDREVA